MKERPPTRVRSTLLISLRFQRTRLPENRFKAYEELIQQLVSEHPKLRRRAAAITDELLPELSDDELTNILSGLAFHIQKHNPEGMIEEKKAQSVIGSILKRLGLDERESRKISRDVIQIGQESLGLLVRHSQTQVGFFHRSLLQYLAALHLSRKPKEHQLEEIREHCRDPQWREVILGLFYLTRRPDDIRAYIEELRSHEGGPIERRRIESLISEVAFGQPFNCSTELARDLAERIFDRIETGAWMPHRADLLENAVRGLRSNKTKNQLQAKLREWFPSQKRWRQNLFHILADSLQSEKVVELCFRGIHDEEVNNKRAAAKALASSEGGDDTVAERLFNIVEGDYDSNTRAAGIEALVEGWLDLERTETVLSETRNHDALQIRLMSIKGHVRMGHHNKDDYHEVFKIVRDELSFRWEDGVDNLLVDGWSNSEGLKRKCMEDISRPGGSKIQWKSLIRGYPQDDDVADFCADELRNEEHPFVTARKEVWELLRENFQGHPKLVSAVDSWIESHGGQNTPDVSRATLVSGSDNAKEELISHLDEGSFTFWAAGALIEGWGMEDDEVSEALLTRVSASDQTAAQFGRYLPEIIEDPDECEERLMELLTDPDCPRPDFVLDGLIKLGDGSLTSEATDVFFDVIVPQGKPSLFQRGAVSRVILHGDKEDSRIQKLAVRQLEERDGSLTAVAQSYIDHPDLGRQILQRICPLPSRLRSIISRRLGEGAGSDSFALPLLNSYFLEENRNVMSIASIAYHERLKASGKDKEEALETLSSTIVSYGPDLNEKRQSALSGLISLRRLDVVLEATERDDDQPASVDVPMRYPGTNTPLLRQILHNWNYVRAVFGDELQDRLTRRDSNEWKLWETLAVFSDDLPGIQEEALENLKKWQLEKWISSDLLRSVSRARPGSDLLLDLCLSTLEERPGSEEATLTAAQLIGRHYGNDEEVLDRITPNQLEIPISEETIVALCAGWPESEVLGEVVDTIRDEQRIRVPAYIHLVCTLEEVDKVIESVVTLRDEYERSGFTPSTLTLKPIFRRIGKDEDLIQAMLDRLKGDASNFEKGNFPRLIGASLGSSKNVISWCNEEIRRQLSAGIGEDTLDIVSGEVRPIIHSLYDAIDAGLN